MITFQQIIRQTIPPSLREILRTIQGSVIGFILKTLPREFSVRHYSQMQIKAYANYTRNYQEAKDLCVGRFEDHERYPYDKYLLDRFDGNSECALDFGCGIGRMMNRMLHHFEFVHGVDLSKRNLEYAHRYLSNNRWPESRFRLFQSDGVGCKIQNNILYDFIYSTLVLQHIPVHEIRNRIISDIYSLLKSGGSSCLQMGFGWDNGTHWFDNVYGARSTNAGHDVSIPNEAHLDLIRKDLMAMGYSLVEFVQHESPHEDLRANYHPKWLFIYLHK
jgi:SAM-dependent methyltransferase